MNETAILGFERTEVWTILTSPCIKAVIPTMISTAFPNDALRRPERVWPSFRESCSVAVPRSFGGYLGGVLNPRMCGRLTDASGIIAMNENEKRRAASQSR